MSRRCPTHLISFVTSAPVVSWNALLYPTNTTTALTCMEPSTEREPGHEGNKFGHVLVEGAKNASAGYVRADAPLGALTRESHIAACGHDIQPPLKQHHPVNCGLVGRDGVLARDAVQGTSEEVRPQSTPPPCTTSLPIRHKHHKPQQPTWCDMSYRTRVLLTALLSSCLAWGGGENTD